MVGGHFLIASLEKVRLYIKRAMPLFLCIQDNITVFLACLLFGRHQSKHFTHIKIFNSHKNNHMNQLFSLLSHVYKGRNGDTNVLNFLPVTRLVKKKAKVQTQITVGSHLVKQLGDHERSKKNEIYKKPTGGTI